jgi:hypothetical protein
MGGSAQWRKRTDVWFMRSYNRGDNWSSPVKMGIVKEENIGIFRL